MTLNLYGVSVFKIKKAEFVFKYPAILLDISTVRIQTLSCSSSKVNSLHFAAAVWRGPHCSVRTEHAQITGSTATAHWTRRGCLLFSMDGCAKHREEDVDMQSRERGGRRPLLRIPHLINQTQTASPKPRSVPMTYTNHCTLPTTLTKSFLR